MVEIKTSYDGQLRCTSVHGPSGANLPTDAPRDNMGKGEAFSPTDLLATSLGSCMLTTMAIVARKSGFEMGNATATVTKEMTATPPRRVSRLTCRVTVADHFPAGKTGNPSPGGTELPGEEEHPSGNRDADDV